jgi:hypothetical protein
MSKTPRQRIDFASADAAGFNALRDKWRSVAAGCALSRAGLRVASILPGYVSREYGYAFVTDEELTSSIGASNASTAKRGLIALDSAGLLERKTIVKRDAKGEAVGRLRRIYLTLPEVKVQEVKVQPEVKVQKRGGEGAYGCTNIPDRTTPDIDSNENKVSFYANTREAYPLGYAGDDDFLDAFDRALVEQVKARGAHELFSKALEQAFDHTTDSSEMFMPFHWRDVCALNSDETRNWFVRRAEQLSERIAA